MIGRTNMSSVLPRNRYRLDGMGGLGP